MIISVAAFKEKPVLFSLNIKDIFENAAKEIVEQVVMQKDWAVDDVAGRRIFDKLRSDPKFKEQLLKNVLQEEFGNENAVSKLEGKICDWSDFYHYLPYLAPKIRIWKLQFKEKMIEHKHEFEGCVNPGDLIDLVIPDVEEVRRHDRQSGKNLKRSYHRMNKL